MKVLITGGNGFIARNLLEQLKEEHEVSAPNREELNLLDHQRVLDFIKGQEFDYVIHGATYDAAPKHSKKDPAMVLENNLRMFFNLTRCMNHFGRMIYFGSGAEFSREHWKPKMREDYFGEHVPQDQYGFSKYVMTRYTQANERILNLRLFGVFGKYEDPKVRLISNICHAAATDSTIRINQNRYYDFMHVDDLARIVRIAMDKPLKETVYNACTGTTVDFRGVAQKVLGISNKKLEIVVAQGGLGVEYSGDNSLLMSELKDFKFTPIDESITALYKWYEKA